jgi:acetyl esterase/lipase
MKQLYTSMLFVCAGFSTWAQTPCDQGRYSTEIFPTVTVTNAVQFGQNTSFTGANTTLRMDIYEPSGDVETARPLIVWAHGGSFIGGTRSDGDVVALSQAFAKRGYVCASIDYRLGMWPIDSTNAVKAVVRAVQDMKAAVRFFYKDKQTTDTYKIDTNTIIIGGSSAGAITALHMAYLDQDCEVEYYISPSALTALGGIEGTSGNAGYSSDVHAVISLAGALASYGWLEAGDIPCVSLQGDDDGIVPYNHGIASVSGFNVIRMDGSRMIEARAADQGVDHRFYTHYGADHAPYATSNAYMDTTIRFVSDFLADFIGCTITPQINENTPTGNAVLYPLSYCDLGVNEIEVEGLEIAPNPSSSSMQVSYSGASTVRGGEIVSLTGQSVQTLTAGKSWLLNAHEIGQGMFILRLELENGSIVQQKILFQ